MKRFRLTEEGDKEVVFMVKRHPNTWGKYLAKVIVAGFMIECEKHGLITALIKFYRGSKKMENEDGIDVEDLLKLIQRHDKKVRLIEVKR